MGVSLGYSLYMLVSRYGSGFAVRHLQKRLRQGKEDGARLPERLGTTKVARPVGQVVWFHAASVGEAMSLLELIKRLSEAQPALHFLVTTGTKTSAEILKTRLPIQAIHQYAPIDTKSAVDRFLDHWQPDLAVWTESELWPCLITSTSARDIPSILINARISEKSARRWRWAPNFAKKLLTSFSAILAQNEDVAVALRNLGVPQNNIVVTGTLKEGATALSHDETERLKITGLIANRPVWLAASTHEYEEPIIETALKIISKQQHQSLLVIVPRHPERGDKIVTMFAKAGWKVAQRSQNQTITADTHVYVADTLGELGLWFRIAPVSFIGGSLVKIGGHNPYEPAALGSAILHGPYVENFADIYTRLKTASAAYQVDNAQELAQAISIYLAPDKAAEMAHAAWQVCSEGAEVTDTVLNVLKTYLPKERS